ncbi:MAG: hypothetical protein U9M92_02535 [Patescibacteria group bacterium]|nr:hypothetical protein [Patescibacteria group bacterium]
MSEIPEAEKKSRGFNASHVAIIILIVALSWVSWSYYQGDPQAADDQLATTGVIAGAADEEEAARLATEEAAEIAALIKEFEGLVLLPSGEQPQLATITDAEALAAEDPFFDGSQDGDKVLLYLSVGKAYILSPDRDLVVNVGPIIQEPTPTLEAQPVEDAEEGPETIEAEGE